MSIPNKYIDSLKLFMETNLPDNKFIANDCLISFLYKLEDSGIQNVVESIVKSDSTYFIWRQPSMKVFFIGLSPLLSINIDGSNRLPDTENIISKIGDKLLHNWDDYNLKNLPLFLGGMKFSPGNPSDLWTDYSDSDWFIPRYLFFNYKEDLYLVCNFFSGVNTWETLLNNLETPFQILRNSRGTNIDTNLPNKTSFVSEDKETWHNKVNEALKNITLNKYQKIVLSRKVEVELKDKPSINAIIENLGKKFPCCYIFAYRKNDSVFFGASPEKLAKISDGWIEADALAGSISRGDNPEEDEKFAEILLNSKKNLNEQNAVVNFIVASFSDFTDEIIYDPQPTIRKLPNIQHLWTPIKGKLKSKESVISILKEIHPTPAICGVPWSTALSHIVEMENYNRGLFTGIIGWFNFECEGEFAVAIRSALLRDKILHAFAGCGIVTGSDPEAEYMETDLKLNAILSLFENEN